ncbi:lysozyme [Asaia siamensis]|uniref:Lysozyme n=1 Tax=Asaia siamensis TaxID=110479 RepID=A0ABQ1MCV9_9PROT|nr:lysozyme [Asaia siamensis]GBR07273.1 phage related lysozyme [Asaia siamensis NRIC 0323]GGC37623.1 hypothetical protein GCM10007207_23930 [Asaia siamensis]
MKDSLEIVTALLRRDDMEGLRLAPYLCPAGYWTIGCGNRYLEDGTPVTAKTKPITEQEANALLRTTLLELRKKQRDMVHVPLVPCQEGALLSWQFNIGTAVMRSSTLLRLLNQRFYEAAGQQLLRWDKATIRGDLVVLPGLKRRRLLELRVYRGQLQ